MDEVESFVKFEIEGVLWLIKAPFQIAAFICRAIKAIINFSEERAQRKVYMAENKERLKKVHTRETAADNYKKWSKMDNFDGEMTFLDVKCLSDGDPRIINIPEQFKGEILRDFKNAGIPYAGVIDFTPEDMNVPYAIPDGNAVAAETIVKQYREKHKYELSAEAQQCKKQMAELEEQKHTLYVEMGSPEPGTAEYAVWVERCRPMDIQIENLNQKYDEIVEHNRFADSEATEMSFTEYLKSSEGTDFYNHPEKAVEDAINGIPQGRPYKASEVLQPIRSSVSVPLSHMAFYLPEYGATITRRFECDKNQVWYSVYRLKTQDGEIFEITDKGVTKDTWNNDPAFLGKLLDKAGILANTECRMFGNEEQLNKYVASQSQGDVSPREEEIIRRKLANGTPIFSSEAMRDNIKELLSEQDKAKATAYVDEATQSVKMTVDARQLYEHDGVLTILLNENESVNVLDVKNVTKDEFTGKWTFEIPPEAEPTYFNRQNYHLAAGEDGIPQRKYDAVQLTQQKLSQVVNAAYHRNDNVQGKNTAESYNNNFGGYSNGGYNGGKRR
jgi:hypothetical protein